VPDPGDVARANATRVVIQQGPTTFGGRTGSRLGAGALLFVFAVGFFVGFGASLRYDLVASADGSPGPSGVAVGSGLPSGGASGAPSSPRPTVSFRPSATPVPGLPPGPWPVGINELLGFIPSNLAKDPLVLPPDAPGRTWIVIVTLTNETAAADLFPAVAKKLSFTGFEDVKVTSGLLLSDFRLDGKGIWARAGDHGNDVIFGIDVLTLSTPASGYLPIEEPAWWNLAPPNVDCGYAIETPPLVELQAAIAAAFTDGLELMKCVDSGSPNPDTMPARAFVLDGWTQTGPDAALRIVDYLRSQGIAATTHVTQTGIAIVAALAGDGVVQPTITLTYWPTTEWEGRWYLDMVIPAADIDAKGDLVGLLTSGSSPAP